MGTPAGAAHAWVDPLRAIHEQVGDQPFTTADIPVPEVRRHIISLYSRGFVRKCGRTHCTKRNGPVTIWQLSPRIVAKIKEGTL